MLGGFILQNISFEFNSLMCKQDALFCSGVFSPYSLETTKNQIILIASPPKSPFAPRPAGQAMLTALAGS